AGRCGRETGRGGRGRGGGGERGRCGRRRCTAVGRGSEDAWCTLVRSDGGSGLRKGWGKHRRARPARQQFGRPAKALCSEEPRREACAVVLSETAVDEALIIGRGGGGECQSHGSQAQLEQAIAARSLGVIVPLWRSGTQDLDLAGIEAEALVDVACLRLERAIVRQKDARGAALDQRRCDGGALNVGERLGS